MNGALSRVAGVPTAALVVALAALFVGGCTRCEAPRQFESFVGAPTTVEAVDALAHPPEVVVTWTREARAARGGGSACAHSPVCVIVLPFVLAEALFPEKLRVATITEGKREIYHGAFRENGQFLQALALRDGAWRKVALLELHELSRNVVVEIAHAPVERDGKPGVFERSLLQPQVDLLGAYRAAFERAEHSGVRENVVREMLTHLEDEALHFVVDTACETEAAAEAAGLARQLWSFSARPLPDGTPPNEEEMEAALGPLFNRCASEERTLSLRAEVGLPLTPEQLSLLAKSADPFVAAQGAAPPRGGRGQGAAGTTGVADVASE